MRLRTLGHLELHDGDVQFLARRRKELVLLAILAHHAPARVRRAELMHLLWEGRDATRARHSLRQALSDLRRVVGDALELDPDAVGLRAGAVTTDATEFLRACELEEWDTAIALWCGDYLDRGEEAGDAALAAWLARTRTALRAALTAACEQRAILAERAGRWSEARAATEWWARHDPENPAARTRLAGVLRAVGRRSEAERLAGFERGASTTLREPDFIGREPELDAITAAWLAARSGARRVVVVAGPAGSGRSRLLREFARLVGERWPRSPIRRVTETPLPNQPSVVLADIAAAPESLSSVRELLASPAESMLILVTAGTARLELDTIRTAAGTTPHVQLRLEPLSLAHARELIGSMAAFPDRLLDSLAGRLHADTAGHPAALVRAMHLLVSEGMIAPDSGGSWRATPGLGVAPLALDDAEERTRRRLDRMRADSRRLVEAASVLEGVASSGLLAAVSHLEHEALEAAIAEATARRLILPVPGSGRFEFPADAVRDAVYRMIPGPRVRRMHYDAARAIRRAARHDSSLRAELLRHRANARLGFDLPWHLRLAAALGLPLGR
jgi:DNA-binding SARP family transcriptional activator